MTTKEQSKHISDIEVKTVANIIEAMDPRGLGEISHLDDYHYSIVTAAYTLRGKGLIDFTYQTQWSSGTTLWASPTGNGTLTVDYNGNLN